MAYPAIKKTVWLGTSIFILYLRCMWIPHDLLLSCFLTSLWDTLRREKWAGATNVCEHKPLQSLFPFPQCNKYCLSWRGLYILYWIMLSFVHFFQLWTVIQHETIPALYLCAEVSCYKDLSLLVQGAWSCICPLCTFLHAAFSERHTWVQLTNLR